MTLLGDTVDEAEENINIRISGPSGVTIRDNDIDIVLRDNDPNPLLGPIALMPTAAITRGRHGLRAVRGHRAADRARGRSRVGRASATSPHGPCPGPPARTGPRRRASTTWRSRRSRLRFAAGANAATFPIHLCGDTVAEIDEEIDVRISGPSGLRIADNDLDLVLRDDD